MYDFFLIPNVTFSFEDTRKIPGRGGGGGGVLVRGQRDNRASILFYLFYFLFILFFSRLAYSAFFFLSFFFSSTSGACAQTNNLRSRRQPARSSSPVFAVNFLSLNRLCARSGSAPDAISTSTSNQLLLV